ncbi:uncharacterized protein [Acropora muricata]|uniref:uncharacterized protein n=1 Tax=Acropora muricata TaxID=159855 RepID=UPI0034E5E52A
MRLTAIQRRQGVRPSLKMIVSLILVFFLVQSAWGEGLAKRKRLVTIEAFKREGKGGSFLKYGAPDNAKTARMSFTGKRDEPGTKFIYESVWTSEGDQRTMEVVLRPAEFPHYMLGVKGRNLIMKNASDVESSEKNYKFEKKRVLLQYDEANSLATEHYHIFMTRSRPHSIIKSSKSGRAFLDKTTNWKDCGAWFTVRTVSNH